MQSFDRMPFIIICFPKNPAKTKPFFFWIRGGSPEASYFFSWQYLLVNRALSRSTCPTWFFPRAFLKEEVFPPERLFDGSLGGVIVIWFRYSNNNANNNRLLETCLFKWKQHGGFKKRQRLKNWFEPEVPTQKRARVDHSAWQCAPLIRCCLLFFE